MKLADRNSGQTAYFRTDAPKPLETDAPKTTNLRGTVFIVLTIELQSIGIAWLVEAR